MNDRLPISALPFGVSDRDIDRDAGYYANCEACGREVVADTLDRGECPRCLRAWLDEKVREIGRDE